MSRPEHAYRATQRQIELFSAMIAKNEKREAHEWDKWDGTYKHGAAIVDRQCERLDALAREIGGPEARYCCLRNLAICGATIRPE